ncbi:hypothetical protein, partial [Pseudomonas aeruginosa]|uniref:hypothetical protein n=1 Tax=Pseudomonas aeruginosa TaxID=287 RepID=UPI002B4054C5
ASAGLDRAYHAIFWDFFEGVPFGLLDHAVRPKPLYHAYELLARVLGGGGDRLTVEGAPDPAVGAALVTRDPAGKIRALF